MLYAKMVAANCSKMPAKDKLGTAKKTTRHIVIITYVLTKVEKFKRLVNFLGRTCTLISQALNLTKLTLDTNEEEVEDESNSELNRVNMNPETEIIKEGVKTIKSNIASFE